jgi:phosphatidylserine synthase
VHLTACGLIAAVAAAGVLQWRPEAMPTAAALVLLYWFFDRADGQLARRQGTVSAWGAWLDGNVDELVDVGLHVAAAAVVASQVAATWPWLLLVAFLAGKYLLMYGLALEESAERSSDQSEHMRSPKTLAPGGSRGFLGEPRAVDQPPASAGGYGVLASRGPMSWLRRAYHLPGNADVRTHMLVLALVGGWLAVELALVAVYYNLRWIVRYVLVARRQGR